jgi:inosine-uridine nucleoside N-ribohydrolase
LCTRYTAENSVKYGAPRDTDHPELRQALAMEVWESVVETLEPGSKITILTNGPLTNLAKIILTKKNTTSLIQVTGFILVLISYANQVEKRNGK